MRLHGARVQKLYAATHRTAVIDLRQPGRSLLLLLSAEPENARVGVVASRPAAPPNPLAFQGLLRAHLTGARIEAVEFPHDDRWVRIRFATPRGQRSLIAELLGRDGNLLLLDERDAILGFGLSSARRDDLRVRAVWTTPTPNPPADEANRLTSLIDPASSDFPLSDAVERLFAGSAERVDDSATRARVLAPLRAELKRSRRTLEKVHADAARAKEADVHLARGELLKANLGAITKGDRSVRVVDWSSPDQAEVDVPLDPALSPRENMERAFHQHRRYSRSRERIDERLREVGERVSRLSQLLKDGEHAADAEAVEAVLDAAHREGLLRASQLRGKSGSRGAPPRLPYREFQSRAGLKIRVGRSARDNDELTLHHARGNDLWLHARGVTGSHVIVVAPGANGPDGETLLDAATLAVHFSSMRGETTAEVAATLRRHVRKVKGSAPGSVQFSQDRTILVRHEEDRLARLLAAEATRQ